MRTLLIALTLTAMLILSGCSGEETTQRTAEISPPGEHGRNHPPQRPTEAATVAAKPEPAPEERAVVSVPKPAPEPVPPVPPAPVAPAPVAPEPDPQAPPPSGITPEQAENRRILAEREATYDGTGPSPWVQGQMDHAAQSQKANNGQGEGANMCGIAPDATLYGQPC